MGSCVSVHKDTESAMKLSLSAESKNDKILIPSPVKQKPDGVNGGNRTIADLALKSQLSSSRFRDAGSREEAFFDSQPWLESDCEDDFLSVNGDFTPSHGNTPVHHKFSSGNPPANNAPIEEGSLGSVPEPSPTDKRKRLSELFKESLRSNENVDEENEANKENMVPEKAKAKAIQPKYTNGTPSLSGGSNGTLRAEEKSFKSAQCCLPRLISSRSFSERKKKMSPAHSTG